jgi:hypothetical protein
MYIQANDLSSSVKNLADNMPAGKVNAAMMLKRIVAIPSSMKIQRQPARPPTPSILMMAVARRPKERIMKASNISGVLKQTSKCTRKRS